MYFIASSQVETEQPNLKLPEEKVNHFTESTLSVVWLLSCCSHHWWSFQSSFLSLSNPWTAITTGTTVKCPTLTSSEEIFLYIIFFPPHTRAEVVIDDRCMRRSWAQIKTNSPCCARSDFPHAGGWYASHQAAVMPDDITHPEEALVLSLLMNKSISHFLSLAVLVLPSVKHLRESKSNSSKVSLEAHEITKEGFSIGIPIMFARKVLFCHQIAALSETLTSAAL